MIREIAIELNGRSHQYRIGELQELRKSIKKFQRRPGNSIFSEASICDNGQNNQWAFHHGGRKELQFNIGKENEGLRYGIAFSLEESQTLPDISLLFPKILKFNQFVRENPSFFADYKMWHYHNDIRSSIQAVTEMSESLLTKRTFIFVGKIINTDNGDISKITSADYHAILATFDELLIPYIYVEKNTSSIIEYEQNAESKFTFDPKKRQLPQSRQYTSEEKSVNLEIRHSLIQEKLINQLSEEWGAENVSAEQTVFGKKIDLVLKRGVEFDFYEIKTCGSAKACIREAIGQLLEYAYWPSVENAMNLIVVGEEAIDIKTVHYLKFLQDKFSLPIRYEQIQI